MFLKYYVSFIFRNWIFNKLPVIVAGFFGQLSRHVMLEIDIRRDNYGIMAGRKCDKVCVRVTFLLSV